MVFASQQALHFGPPPGGSLPWMFHGPFAPILWGSARLIEDVGAFLFRTA